MTTDGEERETLESCWQAQEAGAHEQAQVDAWP